MIISRNSTYIHHHNHHDTYIKHLHITMQISINMLITFQEDELLIKKAKLHTRIHCSVLYSVLLHYKSPQQTLDIVDANDDATDFMLNGARRYYTDVNCLLHKNRKTLLTNF